MRPSYCLKTYLEKDAENTAGKIGNYLLDQIGKGVGGAAKAAIKHPLITAATLGTAAGVVLSIPVITRYTAGPYVVMNESKKRKIMQQQNSLLGQILSAQRRPMMETTSQPQTIIPPLS